MNIRKFTAVFLLSILTINSSALTYAGTESANTADTTESTAEDIVSSGAGADDNTDEETTVSDETEATTETAGTTETAVEQVTEDETAEAASEQVTEDKTTEVTSAEYTTEGTTADIMPIAETAPEIPTFDGTYELYVGYSGNDSNTGTDGEHQLEHIEAAIQKARELHTQGSDRVDIKYDGLGADGSPEGCFVDSCENELSLTSEPYINFYVDMDECIAAWIADDTMQDDYVWSNVNIYSINESKKGGLINWGDWRTAQFDNCIFAGFETGFALNDNDAGSNTTTISNTKFYNIDNMFDMSGDPAQNITLQNVTFQNCGSIKFSTMSSVTVEGCNFYQSPVIAYRLNMTFEDCVFDGQDMSLENLLDLDNALPGGPVENIGITGCTFKNAKTGIYCSTPCTPSWPNYINTMIKESQFINLNTGIKSWGTNVMTLKKGQSNNTFSNITDTVLYPVSSTCIIESMQLLSPTPKAVMVWPYSNANGDEPPATICFGSAKVPDISGITAADGIFRVRFYADGNKDWSYNGRFLPVIKFYDDDFSGTITDFSIEYCIGGYTTDLAINMFTEPIIDGTDYDLPSSGFCQAGKTPVSFKITDGGHRRTFGLCYNDAPSPGMYIFQDIRVFFTPYFECTDWSEYEKYYNIYDDDGDLEFYVPNISAPEEIIWLHDYLTDYRNRTAQFSNFTQAVKTNTEQYRQSILNDPWKDYYKFVNFYADDWDTQTEHDIFSIDSYNFDDLAFSDAIGRTAVPVIYVNPYFTPIIKLSVDKQIQQADQLVTTNSARCGDTVDYVITVKNTGGVAVDVTVEDKLDKNLEFVSTDAVEYNGHKTADEWSNVKGTNENGTVKWTLPYLGENKSATLHLKCRIKADAAA